MRRIRTARIAALLLCAVLAGSCSLPLGGAGGRRPIRVGFVYPMTGVFAAPGRFMREGFELFLEQRGNRLAGRRVEVVYADSRGDAGTALAQARRLVEREGADLLFGPLTAAEGAALVPLLERYRVPAVYPVASGDDLTQRTTSDYVARTGWSSSQTTHPFGTYAYEALDYRTVAAIGFDFAFGWESVGGFARTFEELGGRVVQRLWAPTGTTDFSPYLARIPRGVDAVFVSFSGTAAIRFITQYRRAGLEAPLIAQGNTTDESTLQETGSAAVGIVSALHYSAALDTPANRAFVAAYTARFGHAPSYYAEGTYTAGLLLERALASLGGDLSEPRRLVQAVEASSLEAPRGPVRFDDYGNPIQNVYIRKVERVAGRLQNTVVYTFRDVPQFWTYDPAEFLQHPPYSRAAPQDRACWPVPCLGRYPGG